MEELTQNPEGCTQFVKNPFKPEKCKNCARQWIEHRGVISQSIVDEFVAKKHKVLAEQKAKEDEAKARERAKAIAKKKAAQAVEDKWFYDNADDAMNYGGKSDSDDDLGFRMFTNLEMMGAPQPRASSSKPLKVVNLIDFSACDVPEEDEEQTSFPDVPGTVSGASGSGQPLTAVIPSTHSLSAASNAPGVIPLAKRESVASCAASAPTDNSDSIQIEELSTEIQHLRQMLADANEEKNIQVAIVQDEVIEQQHKLEESNKKRAEALAQLSETHHKLHETETICAQVVQERDEARKKIEHILSEANHQRAESHRLRSESHELSSEVERLRSASLQYSKSAASAGTELRTLLARAREVLLHGEQVNTQEQQQFYDQAQTQHSNGIAGHDLETDLQILCSAARSVLDEATRSSAERKQLITSVEKLEAEVARREALPAPVRQVMPNNLTPSPTGAEEARIRFAEQTLKEIRVNAEQQLAWLHKRMRITPTCAMAS